MRLVGKVIRYRGYILEEYGQFSVTIARNKRDRPGQYFGSDDLWRGEERIQLNKHPYDQSRMTNKLAFDLMQRLPHLPSLRTQFVNLWIDDGAGPVDQGLYTLIESRAREYLINRGLDRDDNDYKANFFSHWHLLTVFTRCCR